MQNDLAAAKMAWLACGLAVLCGCDGVKAPPTERAAQPVTEPASDELPIGASAAYSEHAQSPEEQAVLARTTTLDSDSPVVEGIKESSVLVLAPARLPAFSDPHSSSEPGWYSVGGRDAGADVLIQGTSVQEAVAAHAAAGLPEDESAEVATLADLSPGIVRSEGMVDLYFRVGDVVYNLSVECDQPEQDPRCTSDEYVLELARSATTLTVER